MLTKSNPAAFAPQPKSEKAFTILEVIGVTMIVALFLAGTFYANSRAMSMLIASKETINASKVIQQRIEQLRAVTWAEVTDASTVQGIFSSSANAAMQLQNVAEQVTISQFPMPSPATTAMLITRGADGTTAIATDNPDLVETAASVLVTVRVTWKGAPGGRTRTRETATVIANGGLGL